MSWFSFVNFKFALRLAAQRRSNLIFALSFGCFVVSMAMSIDLISLLVIVLFEMVQTYFKTIG
jgi:hypothetical protein